MKRKAIPTEYKYLNGRYTHHKGPIGKAERDKTPRHFQAVNATRYNRIQLMRKLRLASFVPAVRLVKAFHNQPAFIVTK